MLPFSNQKVMRINCNKSSKQLKNDWDRNYSLVAVKQIVLSMKYQEFGHVDDFSNFPLIGKEIQTYMSGVDPVAKKI